MFIRNCRYVAAWAHEAGAEIICGKRIVFWRDAQGAIMPILRDLLRGKALQPSRAHPQR